MRDLTPAQQNTLFPLPNRKDEAWRYADFAALKAALELPARRIDPVTRRLDGGREKAVIETEDGAVHARETIAVAQGSDGHLLHDLRGAGWLNLDCEVELDDATLTHVILQNRNDDAVTTIAITARLGRRGVYRPIVLQTGSNFGRVEFTVSCRDEDAHFDLSGIVLGKDRQTLEIVTTLAHAVPDTTSRQRVRTVLGGRATGSFLGKIVVDKGAQKTDAEQNSRALLLDRTATINTKPELEIFADDVKCAHGATVGELDERALFYLKSRGIDERTARAMLIEAFVADVVEDIADDETKALIGEKSTAWMRAALERHQ